MPKRVENGFYSPSKTAATPCVIRVCGISPETSALFFCRLTPRAPPCYASAGVKMMLGLTFEWDENKNQANIAKHSVSFNEAVTVFADENAMVVADADHSVQEERFVILGLSLNSRLLVVCHCYRESDTVIRIISARRANKQEAGHYGGVT